MSLCPWDIFFVHMDTFSTKNLKQNFPVSGLTFCCIKAYWLQSNVIQEDWVWCNRELILLLVMHLCGDICPHLVSKIFIHGCLVKTTPKCIEKLSKVLAVETDAKAVFDKIFRTTREKYLIWFQYKLLYNLLLTGRFLFQRQLVDSFVCVYCKGAEETLLHIFGDCPKIQDY